MQCQVGENEYPYWPQLWNWPGQSNMNVDNNEWEALVKYLEMAMN